MTSYMSTTILLVEDQRTTTVLVQRLLQSLGFTDIRIAHDGAAALTHMAETKIGLILSDWHMKGMGGLALVKAVRAHEKWKRTPVIVTSVDLTIDNIKLARHSGADAYLLKPFTAPALRAKIDAVFRERSRGHRTHSE